MTGAPLESSLAELTDIQRQAVDWNGGPLLVLAGPGSGKTRVLTCRVARLLDASRDRRFRILALTFSNAAAHAMASRVANLAPGLEGRATIATFHSFCAEVLRLHGVHLGIKTDFAIYSQPADRHAVLSDALRRGGARHTSDAGWLLPWIDHLKDRLVEPEQAERHLAAMNGEVAENAARVAQAYRRYEDELRRANALDFGSLLLEAHRLFGYPAMARHYQTAYRYWLVDEFQDTNRAQYELFRRMAGGGFREVMAVADDDQTIYEWNGANVRRIRDLVRDFGCEVIQLPTNFRCPPDIVEAANRLVVYNANRVRAKRPATATIGHSASPNGAPIRCLEFATDAQEIAGVADEIAGLRPTERSGAAVLARNRAPLQTIRDALRKRNVAAYLDVRRGDFASAEMRWLVACLEQVQRPMDRRNMAVLLRSFEQFSEAQVDRGKIASRSESEGVTWLSAWIDGVEEAGAAGGGQSLVAPIAQLAAGAITPAAAVGQVLTYFERHDPDDDLKDDLSAWRRLSREIRGVHGHSSLDRFLQELHLRTKEAGPPSGAPSLMTIHRAKGREFDTVYLIGLAEEILPSWRSIKSEAGIEEERRECFVAITRVRQRLILSRARSYRGWRKEPSRFLREMGCLGNAADHADE